MYETVGNEKALTRERERERGREGGREGLGGRQIEAQWTSTGPSQHACAACLGLLGLPQLALLRESQRTWVYSHPATPRLGQAAPHFNDYLGYDMGPLTAGSWSPLHVVRLGFRAPQ